MCVKGEISMINSVSKINFCAADAVSNAQDLLSSPGQFSAAAPIPENVPDSFEKQGAEEKTSKKTATKAIIAAAVATVAAFAALGYAVKSGKLNKVNTAETEGFFSKAWAHVKNAGYTVGDFAGKCWDKTIGKLIGSGAAEKVAEATE